MIFCGACTHDKQQQHQIQIRDTNNVQNFHRVSRNNEQLLSTIMKQIPAFSMIMPSDYEKQLKQCELNMKKFTDPKFPPSDRSLNFTINNRKIVWKRITEIVPNAKIVEDEIDPSDVQQGNVGDCYFLACISSIAEVPERIKRIFCNEMEINPWGIYRMQIVEQGVYKEIIIDDFIPVFEGTNRPVFCRPIGKEVWVMLLEKAWAKISGSYGDTSAGYPHQVLSTFTVAPCFYEQIPFTLQKQQAQKKKLWQKLRQASSRSMPICAGSRQAYTCKGIKAAHTYSILGAYELKTGNQQTYLLKLRNPWGDAQYTGHYSQHDTNFWSRVDLMSKLAVFKKENENDGIFTIEYNEFIRNFECLDISHDIPDYSNFWTKVETKSSNPTFFSLRIQNISALDCYITIEKAFDRNTYIRTRKVQYGYSRLLIARKKQLIIDNQPKISYQYVSSLLETNFPDLTIRQQSLTPGEYIIMAQAEFPNQLTGHLTLSVYSKSSMILQQIECPDRYFLHSVLTNHAHNVAPVEQRVRLTESSGSGSGNGSGDWMISQFLFKEGGYGYTCVCLGPDSKEKVQITGNIPKIYESGFMVQQRNIKKQEGQLNILVQRNQQSIIIFQIDFKRDIKTIAFPPKGLRFARII